MPSLRSLPLLVVVLVPMASVRAADRLPAPPGSGDVLAVRDVLRAGDLGRATKAGEALVQRNPDHSMARLWPGRAYGQQAPRREPAAQGRVCVALP